MRQSLQLNLALTAVLLTVEVMLFLTTDSVVIRWIAGVGAVLAIASFVVNERRRRRSQSRVD